MQEIKICVDPKDKYLVATLYPKWKPTSEQERMIKKVDIIKLNFLNSAKHSYQMMMTPDEALDMANILMTAVNVYLQTGNKEFKKRFIEGKNEICRKYAPKIKKIYGKRNV